MVHAAQFFNIRICVFSPVLGLVGGNATRYSRLMVSTSYLMENESPLECRVQKRLEDKLRAAFEEDPLEDGMHHPAEKIIADALRGTDDSKVLTWLKAFSLDSARASIAASVLQCLGRQDHPGTERWRVGLVRDGLAARDVEIRDAAVQAAELWGDRGMLTVLSAHTEPEPWLRDYVRDVAGDLGE